MSFDLLAVGPHPDDLEIGCGGTIRKLTSLGKKVAMMDLSRGEMGTRGTPEERDQEAIKAASILGVEKRVVAGLKDSQIMNTYENQLPIVRLIRQLRPAVILAPYWECRHPDHYRSSQLIYEAAFLAGLRKYNDGLEPFRPERVFYYMLHAEFVPSFIVDISEQIETKREAILAYTSQFSPARVPEDQTYIAGKPFLDQVEVRSRYYGSQIGKMYGEPFIIKEALEIADPVGFLLSQAKTLNRPMG